MHSSLHLLVMGHYSSDQFWLVHCNLQLCLAYISNMWYTGIGVYFYACIPNKIIWIFFLKKLSNIFFSNFFFKCSNVHERCVIAWIERKLKFQIFPIFIFRVMVIFIPKTVNFRWIFMITRKIKIGKLIFHSIQYIAHLPWKWDQNWGGVCISSVRKMPEN